MRFNLKINTILSFLILSLKLPIMAAPLTTTTPVTPGTSACVSVSTSAWTALQASKNAARTGTYVVNVGTNTLFVNTVNTQAITVTTLLVPGTVTADWQLKGTVSLYGVYNGPAASTVCVTDYVQ